MKTTIVTTQHKPDTGRSVRYHVDAPPTFVVSAWVKALGRGEMLEVEDLNNPGEKLFINPECVFLIHIAKQKDDEE